MMEKPDGAWVLFKDMDLYMLEGGQLMKQMADKHDEQSAEIERLRAALEPLVAEVSTVMRGEHGAEWDAYFGPLFDMLERAQNVLHEAAPRDETAP